MTHTDVRPLEVGDLPRCGWAGSALHLRQVQRELERARRGEVAYLLVLDDGVPVAIGGVDFVAHADDAMLWQLSTEEERRGEGFGSTLIRALEAQAHSSGFRLCRIGVETDNPRARGLYERLGYRPTGEIEQAQWDEEDPAGGVRRHHAEVVILAKSVGELGGAAASVEGFPG